MAKSNTIEFIKKARIVHGCVYDYSLVNYTKSNMNVTILCKVHGEFEQLPNNHLRNYGCYKCSGKMKSTNKEFIEKVNKIHNNFYNYDNVNYINSSTKVCIKCPVHGFFLQQPNNHLNGMGCQKCGGNNIPTKEEFIEKVNKIHNNFYNYDNVNYINSNIKIEIICPKHGKFKQKPSKHLIGHGCLKCCKNGILLTGDQFIENANKIHNNFYNYDKVNYINSKTKINIICPKHGLFNQQPNNHIDGKGCPRCRKSKGEIEIFNIIKNKKYNFKEQYYFKDLRCKSYLKFDFGIFDENNNLICLIEYNGLQHYNFIKHWHKSIENFKVSKYRDAMKIKYCIDNNIKLYIIKYNDNISEKMYEIFSEIKNSITT